MPDIANNDVLEVSFIGDIAGTDEIVQSYQFKLIDTVLGLTLEEGFEEILEVLEAIWAIIDNLYTLRMFFRNIRIRNLTQTTLLGEASIAPPLQGAAIGAQASYQMTIPVSFTTPVSRVILKKMLGPLAVETLDEDGFIAPAMQAIAVAYAVLLLSDFYATNSVWQYGYQSPIAGAWVLPTAGSVTAKPGGLNRRRPGRGS